MLVLEDLHWADPTSLRLTEELAALAADGPLLLLATRRPEPDPGVSDLESALESDARCPLHRVELAPLPEEAERALARSLMAPERTTPSSKQCAQASRATRSSWRNGCLHWSRPAPL